MYRLLAIGLSAGGFPLIRQLLHALPEDFSLPVVVVAHLPDAEESCMAELLDASSGLRVGMASDKEALLRGRAYLAPPGYHLLIEQDAHAGLSFALSVDAPVNSVRPSIDVLFESAAEVLEADLIAVLLSGANSDGAAGMAAVKDLGGLCMVLDPRTSEFSTMQEAAIRRVEVDYVAGLDDIISLLLSVDEKA
jgi:two-component system chemotaxis response regulator CheB